MVMLSVDIWERQVKCVLEIFVLFLQLFSKSKFISKYKNLKYLNLQIVGVDLSSSWTFCFSDN